MLTVVADRLTCNRARASGRYLKPCWMRARRDDFRACPSVAESK